jgi:hypothetical protein
MMSDESETMSIAMPYGPVPTVAQETVEVPSEAIFETVPDP